MGKMLLSTSRFIPLPSVARQTERKYHSTSQNSEALREISIINPRTCTRAVPAIFSLVFQVRGSKRVMQNSQHLSMKPLRVAYHQAWNFQFGSTIGQPSNGPNLLKSSDYFGLTCRYYLFPSHISLPRNITVLPLLSLKLINAINE